MRPSLFSVLIFSTILICLPVQADWNLNPEQSSLSFVSTKIVKQGMTAILENNELTRLSGKIEPEHSWLLIDLDSVNTRVGIRDERIREHVFMSQKYPQARVTVKLKAAELNNVKVGEMEQRTLEADLTMRGQTYPLVAQVRILRATEKRLIVQTRQAILLNAKQYDMQQGFAKLTELVQLLNIPTTIPVHFYLVFERS